MINTIIYSDLTVGGAESSLRQCVAPDSFLRFWFSSHRFSGILRLHSDDLRPSHRI